MASTVTYSQTHGALQREPRDQPLTTATVARADSLRRAATEARFRALVEAHGDAVWRTLRGLGVPAAASHDAAQQVFLVAFRKLSAIAAGSERAFLLGTAVGVAANARRTVVRSREREVSDPDALDAIVDPAPGPEERFAQEQRCALVQRVLDTMPDELRTVVVLFELEGLTSIEIAAMLGIPAGTVASRLRRARSAFEAQHRRLSSLSHERGAR